MVVAGELAAQLGATPDAIAQALAAFAPGQHRRTLVGKWGGVGWVNDSKATNPHAAVASVRAYRSVVLIGGGRNKGLDLAPIVAQPEVRAVIGIGEAADELAAVTAPERFHRARDMEHAVGIADRIAEFGDTVLLAPGCASFDMFTSYGERGEAFTRLVLERKGERDGN
jgi:UDP-N-acetylmuramoylalanine--D-glutamate ligase